MKLLRTASVLVLSAFVLTACDEGIAGVEIADLAGMWDATQFEYIDDTGRTNPQTGDPLSIDAINDAGGAVSLDVEESGGFSGSIMIPGLTVNPSTGETITVGISGTLGIDGDTLTVTFDEQTLAVVCPSPEQCLFSSFDATFTLDGDVLTFTNPDTSFDFAAIEQALGLEPAGPVAAILETRFVR